jgi:hypothetical protein
MRVFQDQRSWSAEPKRASGAVMSDGKTVKIKCVTWDQVEAFYTEKLRGNVLVVKMPFRPGIGDGITVALGLPDGLVFAIDGTVVKIGGEDLGKIPVAIRLFGMTLEVRAQLKRLVSQGRGIGSGPTSVAARAVGTRPPKARLPETLPPASAPRVEDVADEERAAFAALETMRKRLLALPAHAVLDVPPDADGETVRAGFLARATKLHPDLYRRYRSPALRALAGEIFLLVGRAYARMRGAPAEAFLVSAEPASEAPLPTSPPVTMDSGSAVPVEAVRASASSPYSELTVTEGDGNSAAGGGGYDDELTFTTTTRGKALTAEELFDDPDAVAEAAPPTIPPRSAPPSEETAATPPPEVTPMPSAEASVDVPTVDVGRSALAEGRYRDACEAFAAILRAEPRNRQVRALYHVASGMELRQKGDGVKARLMFETALAHDRECVEAQQALTPEPDKKTGGIFKRLFDR